MSLVPFGLLVRHVFDSVIPHRDKGQLVLLGALLLVLYLVAAGLGLFSRYVVLTATKRAVDRLRNDVIATMQTLPPAWLDRTDLGSLHSTVVEDSQLCNSRVKTPMATWVSVADIEGGDQVSPPMGRRLKQ